MNCCRYDDDIAGGLSVTTSCFLAVLPLTWTIILFVDSDLDHSEQPTLV